jgi:secreted PhoX family phosphatase
VPPTRASGPFLQGWAKGVLWISRGEGICHHAGKIYLVDTEAGVNADGIAGRGNGAVWEYDPKQATLRALFVAGSAAVGDNIDNLVVSPRGGMLLCENGDELTDESEPGTRLMGITPDGDSYAFARNNIDLSLEDVISAGKRIVADDYRMMEWAGACFDPEGETLFVNIQIPGITFAIWGPWEKGNL